MTTYTAEDFARAARRIEALTEAGRPAKIGLRHLRTAAAALRLCEGRIREVEASISAERIREVEASWPDEADLRRWHRREHEGRN